MEGWNDSGLGSRSGGADGIRKYCRTKSIVAERVTMKKGAALVSLQPEEGQNPYRSHAPNDVGQRLAAPTRTVARGHNHQDAVASK